MNRINLKKISYWVFILIFGFFVTRCATPKEELKTVPKDYVYSLKEINLEKVFGENRGLKVLEENATTAYDYYRGGVQEKEEGEKLIKESRWEEARRSLEKSNRFLRVVLKYLPEDEASRNVYGEQMVIFLPNLLIADNDLKLVTIYKNLKDDDRAVQAKAEGQLYLTESLKSVKTEWAFQIKKGFEDAFPKKMR
jgi:methionine aminopeptidase